MDPRRPTRAKSDQLPQGLALREGSRDTPDELASIRASLDTAAIAVFDHYVTDGPGYAGKLLVVIWSGSPAFYQVFAWGRDGELEYVPQDPPYGARH